MKRKLITLIGVLALGSTAYGSQAREFWNADMSKSFQGNLVSYSDNSKVVVVRNTKGKLIKFSVDNLSEKDQAYVAKQGPIVALVENVQLSMKLNEGDVESVKKGATRTSKRDVSYDVTLRNEAGDVNDIQVRYTVFYEKGVEKGDSILKKHTGMIAIETLYEEEVDTQTTSTLTLESMVKQNCTTGGWAPKKIPGGRRSDTLLGCVIELVKDGEVLKTKATDPALLAKM